MTKKLGFGLQVRPLSQGSRSKYFINFVNIVC